MKKILFLLIVFLLYLIPANSEDDIKVIYEGNENAKIKIIVYESLTCGHCADFHKNVYPELKKNFLDNGLVKIEFRSFPLDLAALNASKIAHCKNDGKSDILHFLYANQSKWVKGKTIEELNLNLKKIVDKENFEINFNECINNKTAEDHILQDRINGVKNYDVNSTPALIINDKKFDKTINYKNLKKTLEKML